MHRFSAFWLKSIIMPPLRSRGGGILWRPPSRTACCEGSPMGKRNLLREEGFVEKVGFEPGVKE